MASYTNKIKKFRIDNPSQLGPWNRFEEKDHQEPNLYHETKNTQFKVTSILPRVTNNFNKKNLRKQKQYLPLRLKPLQLKIQEQESSYQSQQKNPRQSQTLSFQPNSYLNNPNLQSPGSPSKDKNFQNFGHIQSEPYKKFSSPTRKISKIDLLADYQQSVQNQQKIKNQLQSQSQFFKDKQKSIPGKEFSKKRSLMQLLKFLKQSSANNLNLPISQRKSYDDSEDSQEKGKDYLLNRYDFYRERINVSLQENAKSNYLPYFSVRKSGNLGKKK